MFYFSKYQHCQLLQYFYFLILIKVWPQDIYGTFSKKTSASVLGGIMVTAFTFPEALHLYLLKHLHDHVGQLMEEPLLTKFPYTCIEISVYFLSVLWDDLHTVGQN